MNPVLRFLTGAPKEKDIPADTEDTGTNTNSAFDDAGGTEGGAPTEGEQPAEGQPTDGTTSTEGENQTDNTASTEGDNPPPADQTPPPAGEQQQPPQADEEEDAEPQTFDMAAYVALQKQRGKKPKIVCVNNAKTFRSNLIKTVTAFYAEHGIKCDSKNVLAGLVDKLLDDTEAAGLIRLTSAEVDEGGNFLRESDPDTKKFVLDKFRNSIKTGQKTDEIEKELKALFGGLSDEGLSTAAYLADYTPPKGEELDAKDLAKFVAKLKPGRRAAIINACKAMSSAPST